MRVFLRFCFLLVGLLAAPGLVRQVSAQRQPAQFTWAQPAYDPSTTNTSYVQAISATDASGNTYSWLSYHHSFTLDDSLYVAPDTLARMALVKFDPAGHVVWLRQLGTDSARIQGRSIITDAAGNVYVAGSMLNRRIWFEGQLLDSGPLGATFLAKWAPTGAPLFARVVGRGGDQYANYMQVDGGGNIYLAGLYHAYIDFGTTRIDQANYGINGWTPIFAAYCAKLSPLGVAEWAQTLVDTDSLSVSITGGMGIDTAGNVYLFGAYLSGSGIGSFVFPPAPTLADGDSRQFWAKMNADGRVVQARTFTSPGRSSRGGQMAFAVNPTNGFSYGTLTLADTTTLAPDLMLQPNGSNDALVFCLNSDGIYQWVKQVGGSRRSDYLFSYDLSLDGNDRVLLIGQYQGNATIAGVALPYADTTSTAHYNLWAAGLDQKDGQSLWAIGGGGGSAGQSGAYTYRINPAPSGAIVTGATTSDTVHLGGLTIATQPGNRNYKTFIARITQQYSTLTGTAYLDANADGLQNPAEGGFPGGLVVEVNPGAIPCAAPEATGRYNAYLGLGVNYAASLPAPPLHYTVVAQGPATATFSSYGLVAAGRSFALQPIPGRQDVAVVLTLNSAARPGFPAVYDVQYRNVGTVAIAAGTLTLAPDARLSFRRSQPAATPGAGGLLTWAYTNLAPGEMRRMRIEYVLANSAVLGSALTSTAQVLPLTGDLVPTDNNTTDARRITGSFDPNDIQVNHIELNTTQVAAGEWLEYTIRFQNHGSDTAFTVLVQDSLSARHLRLSTLQLRAASHGCGWSISPTGQVLVRFSGINLPPQSTDIFAADGFVRFRLRPVATLAAGDEIPNRAQIFFDYNAPFATNTVLTRIQTPTGFGAETDLAGATTALVWPNPTAGAFHVEVPRETAGTLHLSLLDALGRVVRQADVVVAAPGLARATLGVHGLPTGLYVLRGTGAGGSFARRVTVAAR
ncbi:MAG: SBBP repeat-containing protein [Hymenobacteraceae bacterium]|nr:SBBP repeat-containing protein [Hymenobacteraceae bacterium]